jgi:hypothetical protein
MQMEKIDKQTFVLRASAKCFERMANLSEDDAESAAMYLVARSLRSAAAYAQAAGQARLQRAAMELRAASTF